MADIALAIKSHLTADTTLSGLVGDRYFPQYDPGADHVYPLVVYKVDISADECFDGPTGIFTAVVRLAAISDDYTQAGTIAMAIAAAINGKWGTWGGTVVQGVFLQENGMTDEVVTEPTTEEILSYVKVSTYDATYST